MAAITTLLLRAASSAAPLAIRVLARRQFYHSALFRPLALGNRLSPKLCGGSPFPSHPFSSYPSWLLDSSMSFMLLKGIDYEIKSVEEVSDDHDRNDEIPNQFPFKIVDGPGIEAITLTRDYHGQHIEVFVSMPDLVTKKELEDGEDGEDDDNKDNVDDAAKDGEDDDNKDNVDDAAEDGEDDDSQDSFDDEEVGAQSSIQLVVKIYEEDEYGLSLELYCTAYKDEVTIDEMYVLGRGGPKTFDCFSNLDEACKKNLHKNLEVIGISPRTTNFLHECMFNKGSRVYLIWLKELKDFIQKWK